VSWLTFGGLLLLCIVIYLAFAAFVWVGVDRLNRWLAKRRGVNTDALDEIERDDCSI
jgi:hypothetical protein